MEKPWDKLRKQQPKKLPIGVGSWRTTRNAAPTIFIKDINERFACIGCGSEESTTHQSFNSADLRQLAEFCTELADQLDGK